MQKYSSKKKKAFSDRIYSQQMGTAGNVKGSSLGRRIIQDGNLELHKGIMPCYISGKL